MRKKISVLAVGDPAVDVYVNKEFKVLEKFSEENDIDVDFNIVPWELYYETLTTNLASKRSDYDIVMVAGHFWLKDFVSMGYLKPIKDLNSDVLSVIKQELIIDGKTYIQPSFCDGHIIIYRPSIVERKYGKVDEVISTDQYYQIAKSIGNTAISMKADTSEIFLDALPYIRNRGVEPFSDTGDITFDNEDAIKGLDDYIALKEFAISGTECFGNVDVRDSFQRQKVAMITTWGGQIGEVLSQDCQNPDDIAFATFDTAWNVTWGFAIPASAKNIEEAQKLLDYLGSSEIDRLVGGFAGSPVRKSTYEIDSNKYSWYSMHLKLIENYAKPLPSLEGFGAMTGPLYENIHSAFTGKITSAEAIRKSVDSIKKVKK